MTDALFNPSQFIKMSDFSDNKYCFRVIKAAAGPGGAATRGFLLIFINRLIKLPLKQVKVCL